MGGLGECACVPASIEVAVEQVRSRFVWEGASVYGEYVQEGTILRLDVFLDQVPD